MRDDVKKFLKTIKAIEKNGALYVWGAQGEKIAETSVVKLSEMETGEHNVVRIFETLRNLLNSGKNFKKIKMFDCSGLIMYTMNKHKLYIGDLTANDIRNKSVSVKKLKAGCFVFQVANGRAYHVGVYIGNGHIIEARGRDYGVVKRDYKPQEWQDIRIWKEWT